MKRPVKFCVCGIAMLLLETAAAQGPGHVSVGDFSGTANERVNAAIAAAMATEHKTVFFPNGTYALQSTIGLNQGTNTEIHLLGESRDGVFLIPDIPFLEANYNGGDWENGGARLAHMINLGSSTVFDSVDVSLQNMTIDMRHQRVMGEPATTYNVVGHGVRVGTGWVAGQFTVNEVTIRNIGGYGVGIQDRDGHPKNNITLTNLLIERTGSDGIDTKEASGDGNRNLVIRNVNINEVGFTDTGAAPALDVRYRDIIIENVNIVSRHTQPTSTSSVTGVNFRPWDNGPGTGIAGATVSNVYIRGTATGMRIHAADNTPHENIAISDFRIQGQRGAGIDILGTNHSGHTISDGFVDPAFGGAAVVANGQAVVTNVIAGRWDPALTPLTETTFENNVSLAGKTYSPAWIGIVGSERVSINPTAPGAGPFVFDVGNNGVMQIDYDGTFDAMDKLIVDGTLNLDGQLRINTISGTPTTAGTYQLFEADAITGSFDSITLPAVPGLTWVSDKLATDGTISLQQPPNTIIPVNSGNFGGSAPGATVTQSIDLGAGADMLIVMTASELGGLSGDPMTVTYGGVTMNLAVGNRANSAIWYLDLSTPGITGTDVVVDMSDYGVRNGFAAGWVSIDGNLGAGESIALHAMGTSASQTNTVDLTTTVQTFNVVNFNANSTSKAITVNSPNPTVIYNDSNIGSAEGAAAHASAVVAGSHTYQWTLAGLAPPASDYRRIDAAAFAIVGNDFSDWIAGYPGVGGQTGLDDDPDGDGNPNSVEAWFGTNPTVSSGGIANLATSGTTTTFTHPRSANPPDDLSLVYQWSPNLADWYAGDGVDGPPSGPTVTFSSETAGSITTVTATASELLDRIFVRAGVALQN